MKFNEYGNLDGGIVTVENYKEITSFFIDRFPNSITRKRNFDGFNAFRKLLSEKGLDKFVTKYWIDGSFTTNKLNPNDIDIVVHFNGNPDTLYSLYKYLENHWEDIKSKAYTLFCDVYYVFDVDTIDKSDKEAYTAFEYQKKYWMGQFGFDRQSKPKGIIEIKNKLEVEK